MDSLPELQLLKFNPDTMNFIRKQYNLDKPGQMDQAIDILDQWIKKQSHFTVKEFPRHFLERQIILNKGSIERAKTQLEKIFTMKRVLSNFYQNLDARNDFPGLRERFVHALLPNLTHDHYRVYCGRAIGMPTAQLLMFSYQFGILILEYIRAFDYCDGFIGVLDFSPLNVMDFIGDINLTELRQFLKLMTEAYQTRVKAIHLLTSSKAMELLVNILKQFLSAKIGGRIHVHMSLESLHEHVPKEVLPKDFGGEIKCLPDINDEWVDVFSTKDMLAHFKKMSEARVDEAYRCGDIIDQDDILGTAGTFRTLSVD